MNRMRCVVFLSLAACSPEVGSLTLTRFIPITPDALCAYEDDQDVSEAGGSLNVASDRAQFFTVVEVSSTTTITQNPVTAGGTLLVGSSMDTPTLDTIRTQYRLLNPSGVEVTPPAIRGRTFAQSFPTRFADEALDFLRIPTGLLAPEVQPVISDAVDIATRPEDAYMLEVFVQVTGQLSRSRQALATGFSRFPIRTYKSDVGTCVRVRGIEAPCKYAGQSSRQLVPPAPACCDGNPVVQPGCE